MSIFLAAAMMQSSSNEETKARKGPGMFILLTNKDTGLRYIYDVGNISRIYEKEYTQKDPDTREKFKKTKVLVAFYDKFLDFEPEETMEQIIEMMT